MRKIKQRSSHLRRIGACLRHQPLNQRKENLLWTPERRCTWSAKRICFRWIGNFDDVEKSNDGHNSQWWSADAWRGSLCQRTGYILDNETLRGYASIFIARKTLRWTWILLWMDERSKTISLKTVFGYSAILKTSYQSCFLIFQRVLPQACFLQHQWHLQIRKLIILRLPQARLPHQPWHLQLCQAKVWLDNGETRVG